MQKRFTSLFSIKNITQIITKDWILKCVSLVLAVILWLFVGGEDRVDKNVMIPLEIINLPRDLVISNQFKKEIEVSVSGPRSLIIEMAKRAEPRQVDLSSATPGTMVIENDVKKVPVPRGITVQRVQPSSIILSLDKLIQKQFPIAARKVGRVARGYYVKSVKIDPDVITITGPQTTLSQFDELLTKDININGLKESTHLQVPLDLDPAIVELIGETSVTVDLVVRLQTVTKTLRRLKVDVELNGKVRNVQPDHVRVTLNIPQLLLGKNVDPKALISVTALRVDSSDTLQVKVIPQEGIELPIEVLSIIPSVVTLIETEDNTPVSGVKITPAALAKKQNFIKDKKNVRVDSPSAAEDGYPSIKVLKPLQSKHKK